MGYAKKASKCDTYHVYDVFSLKNKQMFSKILIYFKIITELK